jgi:hypothetical protein
VAWALGGSISGFRCHGEGARRDGRRWRGGPPTRAAFSLAAAFASRLVEVMSDAGLEDCGEA